MIVNFVVPVFLAASCAEQTTSTLDLSLEFGGVEQVTVMAAAGVTASEAFGRSYGTITPDCDAVVTVMLLILVSVGGVVSLTMTLKLAVALLLLRSTAVQLTVVFPRANVPPGAGKHVEVRMPSTASVATGGV